MRDAFNLVRGAISAKDLVPVLTHFAIHEGHIHGFNGRVHICAPAKELKGMASFTVPALRMMAAFDACRGEPLLNLNADLQSLCVTDTDSEFKATLPLGPIEAFPLPAPLPKAKRFKGPLLPVLKALYPFIGEDASKPWCASIKLHGAVAMATNNIVLAACALPGTLVDCALPVGAVDELLRMDTEPTSITQETDHALCFTFPGGVWMRTSLVADGWPETAMSIIRSAHKDAVWSPLTPALLAAVQQVVPLCPDLRNPVIELAVDTVRTLQGPTSAAVGGFKGLAGAYHAVPLLSVLAVATEAGWGQAPRVPWRGNGLEGLLLALR